MLLGLVGPLGSVEKIIVGDVYGGINFISLSTMEVVDRYVVGTSKVRSLCASSISGESILVGCENGGVFIVGSNVPNRVLNLFDLDGPASAFENHRPRSSHTARMGKESCRLGWAEITFIA